MIPEIISILDNAILDSMEKARRIREMTDGELAEALLLLVWSDLEIFSLQSDLVEEAIERLKNDHSTQ